MEIFTLPCTLQLANSLMLADRQAWESCVKVKLGYYYSAL